MEVEVGWGCIQEGESECRLGLLECKLGKRWMKLGRPSLKIYSQI